MGCANEAARAYTEAILDLLGDEIPIEVLRQTPSKLRVIIEGRADEVLSRPEAPGRWSAVEIIQHLADSEVAWAWRFRLVLSQDRPVLTGYDQDAWAALFKYRDARVEDALKQLREPGPAADRAAGARGSGPTRRGSLRARACCDPTSGWLRADDPWARTALFPATSNRSLPPMATTMARGRGSISRSA